MSSPGRIFSVWLCLAGVVLAGAALAQHPQIRLRPARRVEPGGAIAQADPVRVAELLVEMTNALRRQEGVRPLATDAALTKAATDFAGFMASENKYGHTADGHKPADRIVEAGYDYCLAEENIAWLYQAAGFTSEELARQLFADWQDSPDHRQNLVNPYLGQIGVAVSRSAKTGRYYAVQDFGRPKSEQIVFEVGNASDVRLAYEIDGLPFTLEPRFRRIHKRPIPPELEIAGYDDSGGKTISLHPATGDRLIARRTADQRVAVQIQRGDPPSQGSRAGAEQAAASGR